MHRYSIFNCTLLFSHTVRAQYDHKYTKDGKVPSDPVEPNDVYASTFSLSSHCLILSFTLNRLTSLSTLSLTTIIVEEHN